MASGSEVDLVVAVPTYRRTELLTGLLPRLLEQCGEVEPLVGVPNMVVIDNDPEQTARPVVEAIRDSRIRYVTETQPGVVPVRNRALAEASGCEALIFLDDDQVPDDGWLYALVSAWQRYGSSVAGPVRSQLPPTTDPWIVAGGFFDRHYRSSLVTGDRIPEVATTNLLLDMETVRSVGVRFDERFSLSGGEDSLFTRTITRAGGLITWCAEASVTEPVPAGRLTRAWVCRRAFTSGNSGARAALVLARPGARWQVRAGLMARGSTRILGGSGGILAGGLRRSVPRRARARRTFCRGLGMLLGSVCVQYLPYARGSRRWKLSRDANTAVDLNEQQHTIPSTVTVSKVVVRRGLQRRSGRRPTVIEIGKRVLLGWWPVDELLCHIPEPRTGKVFGGSDGKTIKMGSALCGRDGRGHCGGNADSGNDADGACG